MQATSCSHLLCVTSLWFLKSEADDLREACRSAEAVMSCSAGVTSVSEFTPQIVVLMQPGLKPSTLQEVSTEPPSCCSAQQTVRSKVTKSEVLLFP